MIKYEYKTTVRTILADLYTPVGAYMRLRDLHPMSALMESSDYHDRTNSRSFVSSLWQAFLSITANALCCCLTDNGQTNQLTQTTA